MRLYWLTSDLRHTHIGHDVETRNKSLHKTTLLGVFFNIDWQLSKLIRCAGIVKFEVSRIANCQNWSECVYTLKCEVDMWPKLGWA